MKVSENKPRNVHVRLTEEQFEYCVQMSESLGVTVSECIRMIVNAMRIAEKKAKEAVVKVDLMETHNEDEKNNLEH